MPLLPVNRSYLFDEISKQQLPGIITIIAPAGCGKTTLVYQLIELMQYEAVWHSLDMWQQDVARLHQNSRRVWQQHDTSIVISQDYTSATQSAVSIASEIERNIQKEIFYIFDDIHHLKHKKDAELWLQTLIDTCPPNIHFLFVGREPPTINWHREVARSNVFAINKKQLQCTVDDILKMATIPVQEAEILVEKYNGWIAAIRLAVDDGLKQIARDTLQTNTPEKDLFRQLMADFFQQQSIETQHTLLASSTTQNLPLQLYKELLSSRSLPQLLATLYSEHFFVIKTYDGYRYHELFREYLQQKLKDTRLDYYQQLHLKAARWYENRSQVEQAIIHYLEADAPAQAIHLAEEVANEMQIRGLWQTLLTINALLDKFEAPQLNLLSSIVLTDTNRVEQSYEQLEKAEKVFSERNDLKKLATVHLQRAFNKQQQGQYIEAIEEAEQVLEISLPPAMHAWAERSIGCSYIGLGQYERAITVLQNAVNKFISDGSPYDEAVALQDLSEAYIRSGQFTEGIATLQIVIAKLHKGDNATALAFALNNLGSVFHYTSQYREAFTTLEQAKSMLNDTHTRATAYVYHSLGDLYRDTGKFMAAEHCYEVAYDMAQHADRTLFRRIIISQCRIAIWKQQPQLALQWFQHLSLPPIIKNLDDRVLHIWYELLSVWQNPLNQSTDTLAHHIQYLLEDRAIKPLSKIVGTLGYVAEVHEINKLKDLFLTVVGQLSDNFLQPFIADCFHLHTLNKFVQSNAEIHNRIQIQRKQLVNETRRQAEIENPGYHQVMIKMLGQDTIILDGTELPDSSWASPQARMFFYCLYFFGKQTKSQLAIRLWKEHDAYQARNALRDVKQRIKIALPDIVTFDGKSYGFNPDVMINSDIESFRESIRSARQLAERDARTETLYLRALSLYEAGRESGLLPDLYADWLQPLRQECEDLYVDALCGIARCAIARQDYSFAIRHYEKTLKIAPYDEAIYQQIMRCYALNKQMPQVQIIYNQLEERLSNDLDVAPHPDTTALINRLLI